MADKHKLVAEVDTIKVLHITSGTEIPVWLDTRHVHLFDPVSEKRILSTAKHP